MLIRELRILESYLSIGSDLSKYWFLTFLHSLNSRDTLLCQLLVFGRKMVSYELKCPQ